MTGFQAADRTRRGESSDWPLLIAAFGTNTIAYLGWYTLPLQWAVLSNRLGLDQSQTSLVVTAEVLTAAVVSIVASFTLASRAPRLSMVLGICLVAAGHGYATTAQGFDHLLASRMVAGIGEGLLWVVLNAAIARLDFPDRRYGQVNAATAVLLAVVVVGAPALVGLFGPRGIYWTLLGLTLCLSPSVLPFMRDVAKERGVTIDRPRATSLPSWALLIAVALWSMALTVTYSLAVLIGERSGATEEAIHASIAFSLLGIIAGAGLAGWIGERFGRVRTLIAIFAIEVIASYALIFWMTPTAFGLSLLVVNGCVYAALPYFLGLAASIDRSGGSAAAVAGAFALGGGLSPSFGAAIIALAPGYPNILGAIVVFTLLALLISWLVSRSMRSNDQVRTASAAG